jgi:hypothetical protein
MAGLTRPAPGPYGGDGLVESHTQILVGVHLGPGQAVVAADADLELVADDSRHLQPEHFAPQDAVLEYRFGAVLAEKISEGGQPRIRPGIGRVRVYRQDLCRGRPSEAPAPDVPHVRRVGQGFGPARNHPGRGRGADRRPCFHQDVRIVDSSAPGPGEGRPEAAHNPVIDEDPGAAPVSVQERGATRQWGRLMAPYPVIFPVVTDQGAELGGAQLVQPIAAYFLPRRP